MISYKRTGWRTDVIVGLSSETKPTDVENGYRFCEIDTGYMFAFDAEHKQWHKLPGSSVDEDEVRAIIDDATAELQAELDEAISGATVDSEVINARVDSEGTTYGTLKQRLDAENTELKNGLSVSTNEQFIQYTKGKYVYITANLDPVDLTDIRALASAEYAIVDCEEGDVFTISAGFVGTSAFMITVTDDSGNVIFRKNNQYGDTAGIIKEYPLVIPHGGTKLILNNSTERMPITNSIKGTYIANTVDMLSNGAIVTSVLTSDMFETGGIIANTGEENDTAPRSRTIGYIDKAYSSFVSDSENYRFTIFAWDDNGNYVGEVDANNIGYEKNGSLNWRTSCSIPEQFKYNHRVVTETSFAYITRALTHIKTYGYANTLRAYVDSKIKVSAYEIPWNYYSSNDDVSLVSNFDSLIALYDELVTKYPNYITKNSLISGTFTNYEYVFTTGKYNHQSGQRSEDAEVDKPVVLVITGVHGYEKTSIMSTYAFFKALCDNIATLGEIKEKLTIRLIPCVTPWSFDNNTRWNENGVNINRNFNANWTPQGQPFDSDYSGQSAASESETKVVQNWLDTYMPNAIAFIDHHNSGFTNEVSYLGMPNDLTGSAEVKKHFRYSIDKVISYWKKIRGMVSNALIYEYTGALKVGGSAGAYGANNWNKPTMTFETSWNVNSFGQHSDKSIGVGSESFACLMESIMKYAE